MLHWIRALPDWYVQKLCTYQSGTQLAQHPDSLGSRIGLIADLPITFAQGNPPRCSSRPGSADNSLAPAPPLYTGSLCETDP